MATKLRLNPASRPQHFVVCKNFHSVGVLRNRKNCFRGSSTKISLGNPVLDHMVPTLGQLIRVCINGRMSLTVTLCPLWDQTQSFVATNHLSCYKAVEANSRRLNQQILHLLWSPKFLYHFPQGRPLVPVLNQTTPFYLFFCRGHPVVL